MTVKEPLRKQLSTAICNADPMQVKHLLQQGDILETQGEDSPLEEAITEFGDCKIDATKYAKNGQDWKARRARLFEIIRLLVEGGANINKRDQEGIGPLWLAVNSRELDVLQFLLENGGTPNFLTEPKESLLDWAESDYRLYAFNVNPRMEPAEKDKETEEAWIAYLERAAEAQGVEKPVVLQLLRRWGAKTARELEMENKA